ncbi:MAG: hypothetical protein LBU36_00800 [Clostridiales bacterium]|nr:hypothetical protein [Clostridiales bacterium]
MFILLIILFILSAFIFVIKVLKNTVILDCAIIMILAIFDIPDSIHIVFRLLAGVLAIGIWAALLSLPRAGLILSAAAGGVWGWIFYDPAAALVKPSDTISEVGLRVVMCLVFMGFHMGSTMYLRARETSGKDIIVINYKDDNG